MFYLRFFDLAHPNFWKLGCQVHLFLMDNEFTCVLINKHNIPGAFADFAKQLGDSLAPGEEKDVVIGHDWKVTIRRCRTA